MKASKTLVGNIDPRVLEFTAGKDVTLDAALVEWDCVGSAAHATMLSRMPLRPPVFTAAQRRRVVAELTAIRRDARAGKFRILPADQDAHLAIERRLTAKLGDLGRKVHTARSRNDQVAVALRLLARDELQHLTGETLDLVEALLRKASGHRDTPMVGRTHLQPAMPSSVGLWASAHAESLLDDLKTLDAAAATVDRSPLGSAASYGVPLPIDRALTARLLGFAEPIRNVLYAGNSRGKIEAVVLSAAAQIMGTLSRLAEDVILFSMPEFGYFSWPPAFGTGSSIMPQKNNPDVFELVRAKSVRVAGAAATAAAIACRLPSGYNRDMQEIKEIFLGGLAESRACVSVMRLLTDGLLVHEDALRRGFSPGVFATDATLDRVMAGMPFRQAYDEVKATLGELATRDPAVAARGRFDVGGPADPGIESMAAEAAGRRRALAAWRAVTQRALAALMGA